MTRIAADTETARHVISIENISDRARDARAVASLPYGTARLEFVFNGSVQSTWDKHLLRIPGRRIRILDCDLRRNGGSPTPNEPLQCDELYEKRGTLPWKLIDSNACEIVIDAA